MASKTSRRRQSSAASGTTSIAIHARQPAKQQAPQPKSPHVADPFLHDFTDPSFDAAAYLNAALPPLQTSTRPAAGQGASQGAAVPLAELSVQAQSVLSQLNAHTTRLSNTLTELTNDILRSGGRLAYEVELLRGETLGLAETLSERLEDDISKFVPAAGGGIPDAAEPASPDEPPQLAQLRTLTLVRARLDAVIKTFGEAMEFVFPPSEVSVGSSFLSVSAPDAGGANHSTEEKGQQVLQSLRDEISGLLNDNPQDPATGIEDAARRIAHLKELATVWAGTAEEKGRARFIESLAKMVEDRHRELLRDAEQPSRDDSARAEPDTAETDLSQPENKGYGGYGFISQLQKLRGGL
ncbi:hypothetical protein BT67DRAFT_463240 [Trichocladium antarcticum]|uniref:Uncharacterized protein n=1 Tax=Trichocladium antarcticum TaxID=1450529 RepID=A0AAN6UH88_9PEZI|nr:hypothetical protein BT67DRAFT_463240 [Trichocladium antarcticum]